MLSARRVRVVSKQASAFLDSETLNPVTNFTVQLHNEGIGSEYCGFSFAVSEPEFNGLNVGDEIEVAFSLVLK